MHTMLCNKWIRVICRIIRCLFCNKPTARTYRYVQTPKGKKKIETTVTHKAADVSKWIREIRSSSRNRSTVVGLDTEWRCHMIKNNVEHYSLALLQLCVDDKCLIYQMYWMDCSLPSSLRYFLMNPKFTFVGVGIDQDLAMLRDEYELHCACSEDLAVVARRKWPHKWTQIPGLKTLAREVAGIEMVKNKRITMSNWGEENLLDDQIEYAFLDAYVSYKIGVKLQDSFQRSLFMY